jgi:hypothetical protein
MAYAFGHLSRWRSVLKIHKPTIERVCSSRQNGKSLGIVAQANVLYISTLPDLRPYQKECIDTCLSKFLDHKINRQLVSLPVGKSDKTTFTTRILN